VSESANHNNFFSAEDIRRYHNGEMSAREMNALEKAALDDPFLQDALEGYVKNTGRITEDMDELKTRLHERISSEKEQAVPLRRNTWWYAAAIVLLVAATGVILFLNNSSETGKKEIAKNEPVRQNETLADSTVILTAPPEPAEKPLAKARTRSAPGEEKPQAPVGTVTKEEEMQTMLMESSAPKMAAPAEDSFVESKKEEMAMNAEKDRRMVFSKSKAASRIPEEPHTFSGRVVDRENKPVPGASILVLNNQLGVIADTSGSFNFSLSDSLAFVAVESKGFETANLTLSRNKANYDIRLRESPKDLAIKQKPAVAGLATTMPENAVPTIGWNAYRAYIDKNKKYPSAEKDKHGEVVISFALDSIGKPQNLKVEKSLSKAFDEEAIRLIKEGAAWKMLKEGNTRTVLVVKF
jgi:TonB family protein